MATTPNIAEVVFDLSLDKVFDYLLAPEILPQVQPGTRVLAPFRSGQKPGYILRLKTHSDFAVLKTISLLDSGNRQLPPALLQLATWMADYYCCPLEHAVWTLLPSVVRKGEMEHRMLLYVSLTPKAANFNDDFDALTPKQKEILKTLHRVGSLPNRELLGLVEASDSVVATLCKNGWLTREKRVVERDPFRDLVLNADKPKQLTDDQRLALAGIKEAMDGEDKRPIVLHGVTGSGKTEVYLQAIGHCLERQQSAIVLVPEISLTPQTCERFRSRFGNLVSVMHSGLTDGERFDEWTRLNDGRSQIAIGARSALFAPLRNLGLLIVDEEHEGTYKQEESPRYNARDVAVVRGKLENAVVILGSATPSLESMYNCQQGKYRCLRLPKRVDAKAMPTMEFVDMSQENAGGKGSLFSPRLLQLMQDRLDKQEQTILFLNRRGYASQLLCSKCGYTATCPDCSLSYTYHRKEGKLICHLCGNQVSAPTVCPGCGDPEIRFTGYGTEKIESAVRSLFPQAFVARMDSDTMTTRESYQKVLDAFRKGRINILIGTQMIAKGLDFPDVTLVGIIQADIGLSSPDFRSGERTFQLVTQVAGRAGRGSTPGTVIVQTYSPYHFALQAAREHDCTRFYNEEMPSRRALDFPPYTHMVMLNFRSQEEELAAAACKDFTAALKPRLSPQVQAIGPMPAPLSKVKSFYRYQISLRGGSIRALIAAIRQTRRQFPLNRKVELAIDVDPRSLS